MREGRDHEEPPCPLCATGLSRVLYRGGRLGRHRVVSCRSCGLMYLSPRLPWATMRRRYEGADYYEGGTGSGYLSYGGHAEALGATFRRVVGRLARLGLTGGRLLEVGCGYGFFLREARAHFEVAEGTDYACAALAKARPWADALYEGGLESVPAGRRYDLLVANQVIEHVYHPLAFMAAVGRRLRPGGAVLLSTPDGGGIWRRLLGRRWPSFIVPDHVVFYDAEHLKRLAVLAGFDRVSAFPYPHAFPLGLAARKMGLPLPGVLGGWSVWIPGTTVSVLLREA